MAGEAAPEGSDPWRAGWLSDEHRRLEILGDPKVLVSWVNAAWEVKGDEHAKAVREIIDQFVRWYLGGTLRPRTEKADWCKHISANTTKPRTRMPTGSLTMVTRHKECSLRHTT